ncbi:MAG: helix-turn-helix domain-containing protein [Flavobacteriales bacterium]|nr:helix-turn-helix domain-containing protein [Flavobacteriales bacterium]
METEAFYRLLREVVDRLRPKEKSKWVKEQEAMELLGIKSKTTLWKLRSEGKIRYAQPSKKVIMYDRSSIDQYLEKNSFETF